MIVTLILVSYGALGARQPAVRTSVPLPVPAEQLATALGLNPDDHSQILISLIRLLFDAPDGSNVEDAKRRALLSSLLKAPKTTGRDLVPLPLDTSIWRETLMTGGDRGPRLDRGKAADAEIAAAIMSDRSTALLYHGLAALDDDTLGWLGPDRETLLHLRRNAAIFAAFGRSLQVRGGKVSVPGGTNAEPLWTAIVGADPSRPAAFVQRLVRGTGRLAWFYDVVQHLDANRQNLVLGRDGSEASRVERLRELLNVFESVAPEWLIPERPFVRPLLDPGLVISLVSMAGDGELAGPRTRQLWETVFRDEGGDVVAGDSASDPEATDRVPVEPAWLTRRIALVSPAVGRRRLETFLFAQRVFSEPPREESNLLTAIRSAAAFPALALTLERIGITDASTYTAAARAAAAVNGIRSPEWRRIAVAEFQSAVALIDRAVTMGGLDRTPAHDLVVSLAAVPILIERGYDSAFAEWLRRELVPALPLQADASDPVEDAVLAACAGLKDGPNTTDTVEWEGRRYRVDPAAAELKRLRRIRERQRGPQKAPARATATLGARLEAAASGGPEATRLTNEQALADVLTAIVYAIHLGEPDGAAASAGNVSARHDFALSDGTPRSSSDRAWRFPREERGDRGGWHVVGSLLGLEMALGRLSLRRLDLSEMPGEPTMTTNERASATLTAAFFAPASGSDKARDDIAAAIARGRARVAALQPDRTEIDRIAREAGLSEWRREALGWTIEHEREKALSRFSLGELFWLGSPRTIPAAAFDAWGAATVLLDGCLCLRMPRAEPWEMRAGRPSTGYLSSASADVGLRTAALLAELKLPATLAPAVVAYATQDVIDFAKPAFYDDWAAFQRTARDLPRERLLDYISAIAADGPLIPITSTHSRH
jgi:hypothetical protein